MAGTKNFSISVQAVAIILGASLAGAMMSLSLITIPLFLDTNTQVSHMLRQWSRLYAYGHIISPVSSVAVFGLYLYKALQKRQNHERWALYILAAMMTTAMIPYTLTVMANTNETLFALTDSIQTKALATPSFSQVQELVATWGRMHFVRSCFPLAGAVLGFSAAWEDFACS